MKIRDLAHRAVKILAVVLVLAFGVSAAKTEFRVLHNFTGGGDGGNPIIFAALAIDKSGDLYGATYRGGTAVATVRASAAA
jgi:hypothetical protein